MGSRKTAKKTPTRRKAATRDSGTGFTAEERAAMRERSREVKAAARGGARGGQDAEGEVLSRIDAMAEPDRGMGRRLHALVRAIAPDLVPRLWYGMPAYARAGKVVCFFQGAQKFKTRYSTFAFTDAANLDDGPCWPVAFALGELTAAVEARIAALVRQASG